MNNEWVGAEAPIRNGSGFLKYVPRSIEALVVVFIRK